eukprot:jgi/Botrbrau1/15809/Bobra.4_1s0158.1
MTDCTRGTCGHVHRSIKASKYPACTCVFRVTSKALRLLQLNIKVRSNKETEELVLRLGRLHSVCSINLREFGLSLVSAPAGLEVVVYDTCTEQSMYNS